MDADREDVLLLVSMGDEAGGRVDPDRILCRPPGSRSRAIFMRAQDAGWIDGKGWVTDEGRAAVAAWRRLSWVTPEQRPNGDTTP